MTPLSKNMYTLDGVSAVVSSVKIASVGHSPLQKVGAVVRVPDSGTEGENARRMSGSVVGPMSSRDSGESNDIHQILVEIGTRFLQERVGIRCSLAAVRLS